MKPKYLVEVNNEILGNSKHIMTEEQIKDFNICAYNLCQSVKVAGGIHTSGMWTVREVKDVEEIVVNKHNDYLISETYKYKTCEITITSQIEITKDNYKEVNLVSTINEHKYKIDFLCLYDMMIDAAKRIYKDENIELYPGLSRRIYALLMGHYKSVQPEMLSEESYKRGYLEKEFIK